MSVSFSSVTDYRRAGVRFNRLGLKQGFVETNDWRTEWYLNHFDAAILLESILVARGRNQLIGDIQKSADHQLGILNAPLLKLAEHISMPWQECFSEKEDMMQDMMGSIISVITAGKDERPKAAKIKENIGAAIKDQILKSSDIEAVAEQWDEEPNPNCLDESIGERIRKDYEWINKEQLTQSSSFKI